LHWPLWQSVRRMKPWRRHGVTQSPMRGNEETRYGDKGECRARDWKWYMVDGKKGIRSVQLPRDCTSLEEWKEDIPTDNYHGGGYKDVLSLAWSYFSLSRLILIQILGSRYSTGLLVSSSLTPIKYLTLRITVQLLDSWCLLTQSRLACEHTLWTYHAFLDLFFTKGVDKALNQQMSDWVNLVI